MAADMDIEERNYPSFIIKTREKTHTPNGEQILYGIKEDPVIRREMINFFRDRILTDLSNAPPGLYTWIMRGTKDNNRIYASQTRSKQELGTLHKNLFDLTNYKDKRPLFAAGELKIDNQGAIEFNLQSGLFDTSVLKAYKTINTKLKFVINNVVPVVIKALNSIGINHVQYLVCQDDESCDKTEITGGKHLLSKELIFSSNENIAIYNHFFNRINSFKKGGSKRSKKHRRHRKKSVDTKKR